MRRLLPLVLLLAGCPPHIDPGPAAAVTAQAPTRLVAQPDPSSPNVYLQVIAHAGSARDPIGKEGLAWLTARSMVEAGAGERDGEAITEALFPTGNAIEQVIDREWVSLRLTCHRDHATTCLELFSDILVTPRFDEADVLRLRDEALYQVGDGILGDEEALGDEVLDSWLFEAHPYGHPVQGRAGVIPLLEPADLESFHRAHYVRESVVGGLAGAFDEDLRAAFQARLDELPSTRAPELALPAPTPVVGRSLLVVETTTEVTGFHFGHPLDLERDDADWPALLVAMTAFGAHRQGHGRLFRTLRGERALNYGDYAYLEPFVQRGWTTMPEQGVLRQQPYFSVWIRPTSLDNGPFALKLAIPELERLVADGLTPEEFEKNRSYLLGHVPLEAQTPGRRLAYALDAAATGLPDLLAMVARELPDLTLAEVNEALRAHLRPEDLRIVAVSGQGEVLSRSLVEESATPIVYNDVEPTEDQAARDKDIADLDIGLAKEDARVVPAQGIFR